MIGLGNPDPTLKKLGVVIMRLSRIQKYSPFLSRNLPWMIFLAFGVTGATLLLGNSPWGIGITHDSVFYLNSASNLTEGEGLYWISDRGRIRPLTHFAPLYPVTLSSFISLGLDAEVAARWIAAILYGAIIFLIGYLIYHFTRRMGLGVLASALALSSPVILGVHTIALSEPLFLLITLGFLAMLTQYVFEPNRSKFILAAGLAALGYLTRYVGVTLLFTGSLSIFLLGQREFRSRLRDAVLFFLLAFAPMALWMLRNYSLTGTMTNRTLLFHPPGGETLINFLNTIVSWILPFDLSIRFQVIIVVVSTAILIYLFVRTVNFSDLQPRWNIFISIIPLFLAVYLFSLAFSITFVDAATHLDDRILSPFYLGLLILSILLFWSNSVRRKTNALLIPLFLLLGVFVWNSWLGSSEVLGKIREDGIGFTSRAWRESETIEWVSNLPEESLIYTNERFAVSYITGRPAFSIPEKTDPVKAEVRPEFDQALAKMRARLEAPDAYLLLFHPNDLRHGMPTQDEITFSLSILEEFNDSLVYIHPAYME